eukprot:Skav201871  [mRNA]  locus=scaffold793:38709:43221:- [translate_table: standard]
MYDNMSEDNDAPAGCDESEPVSSAERYNELLGEAEAELELRSAEFKACGEGRSWGFNPGVLRSVGIATGHKDEEYQALQAELSQLQELGAAGSNERPVKGNPRRGATRSGQHGEQRAIQPLVRDAPQHAVPPFRVSRSAILEDELRQKTEVVRQLRQRELWFELQLQRQQEGTLGTGVTAQGGRVVSELPSRPMVVDGSSQRWVPCRYLNKF